MATSNTQVTIYLPDHILNYVTCYCNEYGVVRKKDSKPLLATGIVDLLNVLVNIPVDELATAKQNLSSIDVESIVEKKMKDSKVIGNLLDTLLDDMAMVERLRDVLSPMGTVKDDKPLLDTLPVKKDIKDTAESPIMPLNNELGTITPEDEQNPNKVKIEQVETKENVTAGGEIELTEKQKEVMTNLDNIPSGEKFSYNSLAKTLGVTRTVLDSFELWKEEFKIEPKLTKEGKENGFYYVKE